MQKADTDSFVLNIINKKLVGFREIVVCFFENCNLACAFCPQDHASTKGLSSDEVLSKAPQIIDFCNQNIEDDLHLHLMGGELFQDKLIDNGFLTIYDQFIQILKSSIKNPERLQFNFITNLTTQRNAALQGFCDRHGLQLSVSYDPAGRFDAERKKIFEDNLVYFKDYIQMVSCVLTVPNMNRVMQKDPLFDFIYNHFPVDWDSLIPSLENSKVLMPKESELLIFLKHLVDHYPKCINLANYFSNNSQQRMRCTRGRSLTVMPDNSNPLGCSGSLYLKENKTADLTTQKIVRNFLEKYNCLSCEYYSRCPFTCFIKQDYKHLITDVDTCVYKSVFSYVDQIS